MEIIRIIITFFKVNNIDSKNYKSPNKYTYDYFDICRFRTPRRRRRRSQEEENSVCSMLNAQSSTYLM